MLNRTLLSFFGVLPFLDLFNFVIFESGKNYMINYAVISAENTPWAGYT